MDLIQPAVTQGALRWADLGAGSGNFTEALAHILGPGGSIIAVDKDRVALSQLRRLSHALPAGTASVVVAKGDVEHTESIRELIGAKLDGVLLGNVLHFVPDPATLLQVAVALLAKGGKIVVLEYDDVSASPWIPYPVSKERLGVAARKVGLPRPVVVAEKRSRYRGTIYCALLSS